MVKGSAKETGLLPAGDPVPVLYDWKMLHYLPASDQDPACVRLARKRGKGTFSGVAFGLFSAAITVFPGLRAEAQEGSPSIQLPKPQTEIIPLQIETPTVSDFEFFIAIPDSRRQVDLDALRQVEFSVEDIVIEGSTVFKLEELRPYYEKLVGVDITLAELYGVTNAIEAEYRKRGYSLSRAYVPAQRVTDGVFRLSIVEGYIGEVLVQGDDTPTTDKVRRILETITTDRPLSQSTLERALLLVNDLPGVSARSLIRPGSGELGNAQLVVTVTRTLAEGYLRVDNLGSESAGPVAGSGGVAFNSFETKGGRLEVNGLGTQELKESRGVLTSYAQSLSRSGLSMRLGGFYFVSEPTLRDISQESTRVNTGVAGFTAGLSYPIILSRNIRLDFGMELTIRDSNSFLNQSLYSSEKIRSAQFKVDFLRRDSWGGTTQMKASAAWGLPIFGASEPDILNGQVFSRQTLDGGSHGKSIFKKYNLEIIRNQTINGPVSFLLAMRGQYSNDYLVATETFSVGGVSAGRGYDYGEISGDRGLVAATELRYTRKVEPSDLLGAYASFVDSYEFYTFADFGIIWNNVQEPKRDSIFSVGWGSRFTLQSNLDASFEIALPLTRHVEGASDREGNVLVKGRLPTRYSFSLLSRF